jgi:hypothetical protein
LASVTSWQYGIVILPLPFLFKDRRKRQQVSLLVSTIATPFFGVYSYIVFFIFYTKWWAVVLSLVMDCSLPSLSGKRHAICLDFTDVAPLQYHPERIAGTLSTF